MPITVTGGEIQLNATRGRGSRFALTGTGYTRNTRATRATVGGVQWTVQPGNQYESSTLLNVKVKPPTDLKSGHYTLGESSEMVVTVEDPGGGSQSPAIPVYVIEDDTPLDG